MKKWSGGFMITGLAMILIFRYTLIGSSKPPDSPKQSAYDFFNGHSASPIPSDTLLQDGTRTINTPSTAPKPWKRPTFVHFQGLDVLYSPKNVSQDGNRALLVWAKMRSLLSRSDALPETEKGIKEASLAWKELYSQVVISGNSSVIRTVDEDEDKNCPPFVSSFFGQNSTGGLALEIPCGLIADSSVTLVGIPQGTPRNFQISFVGSPVSGEGEPPVVLHYNVSVPGENMTEQPYILQNSWSSESGWDKEERCPAHGSINSFKVDGLPLCNQEVVGGMEHNANLRHSNGETAKNASRGTAHAGENFPFGEGSLFIATVWAGLEGFHLTVNGRQETSLPYREKLEPWSVGEVRTGGNLNLLSAIAKGLPVSENHDLIADLARLKAPVISRKRILMLVGVFSTGNNFERRMALRRSWMQYEVVRSGNVAVRFFIGLHKNKQVNLELWKEALAYGDIQFMPFVDYYGLISYKTVAICIMGTKILPAKYIMKTDDDAFVRIDEVISSLKEKPSNGLLYGMISLESSPDRDKDSKWYISNEEWSKDMYPPWAHGPGYIISRDIAKFIVKGHQEGNLQLFKLEDVAMGIWIEQYKNNGQEVHYINDERFYNAGCEPHYILAHYQGPRKVLCLWEKLLREHEANCCE